MRQTFADILKQLREDAGVSQGDLAKRSGTNQAAISKLELGKREPSLEMAQMIARALGLSLSTFDDVVLEKQGLQKAADKVAAESAKPPGRAGRPRKPTPPVEPAHVEPESVVEEKPKKKRTRKREG